MQQLMPPLCLVLSLALLVTGFALLAIDAPEPNVDLHRAGRLVTKRFKRCWNAT